MVQSPTTRPIGGQQSGTHWNSSKRQRTLSMTDDAWNLLSEIAASHGWNRSEAIEVLIRHAHAGSLDLPAIRNDHLPS